MTSDWQGFDPRKVCPNCEGYQTGFGKRERIPASRQGVLALLVPAILALLLIAIFITLVIVKGAVPDPGRMFGVLLTALLGIGTLLFNKDIRKGIKESDHNQEPITVYRLSCHDCGHTWEMTVEEWEKVAQKEREELIKSPAFLPQSKDRTVEPLEEIEWKSPDPTRGILIVVSAVILLFVAFLSVMGAIWYVSNPGHLYGPVIGIVVILFAMLGYAALAIVRKWMIVKLMPMIGIGFLLIALWFLLR